MACCGGKRRALYAPQPNPQAAETGAGVTGARQVPHSGILFQYVGRTGMTVVGPITGRRYRFERGGAPVEVDARDSPGLFAVPNLERVRS